tara:strand:- start:5648 stop:6034 length:387 start_codon:yes stop_codon:yes gene_type:complete
MKTILAFLAVLFTASTSLGGSIPSVNFICLEPEPIMEIVKITYEEGKEAGGEAVGKYASNSECWYVNPTLVEVVGILEESLDPEGKLWAVVAVKPHKSSGLTNHSTRYAVIDAQIAKGYIRRHGTGSI